MVGLCARMLGRPFLVEDHCPMSGVIISHGLEELALLTGCLYRGLEVARLECESCLAYLNLKLLTKVRMSQMLSGTVHVS